MNRPASMELFGWLYGAAMLSAVMGVLLNVIYAPVTLSRPVMIGMGTVMYCLLCLLGYKVYEGRRWARLLVSFIVALSVASMVGPRPPLAHHPLVGYLNWVCVVLETVAIGFLYRKESREWFLVLA